MECSARFPQPSAPRSTTARSCSRCVDRCTHFVDASSHAEQLCMKGNVPEAVCGVMQGGTWTAILDVSGEAYQAFFDSQGAAMEALNAAGVLPRTP